MRAKVDPEVGGGQRLEYGDGSDGQMIPGPNGPAVRLVPSLTATRWHDDRMRPLPRLPTEWVEINTTTMDGIRLRGVRVPGPPDLVDPVCFVICHGMTNSLGQPGTTAALKAFARHGEVVAFDFRGHGRSGGRSTVGADEVADVEAAIAAARAGGHQRVVLVGFSMGGAIILRHQGGHQGAGRRGDAYRHAADAVVSVSAPARWFLRETRFMRRVQWLLEHPAGIFVGPRVGIRLGAPWRDVPSTPLEEVAHIAPTPLLIVHGDNDHYFDDDQGRLLHRAAPGSELWIIEGMGHAESGISAATIDRIAAWAAEVLAVAGEATAER